MKKARAEARAAVYPATNSIPRRLPKHKPNRVDSRDRIYNETVA